MKIRARVRARARRTSHPPALPSLEELLGPGDCIAHFEWVSFRDTRHRTVQWTDPPAPTNRNPTQETPTDE